jgi:hypothetical protein
MMFWNSVDVVLATTLKWLMQTPAFESFRLVGGTSLSLQLGHRLSVDIDLFTDQPYGAVDFSVIDQVLLEHFPYVDASFSILPGMGRSYIVGEDEYNAVKLDIYYTDDFIRPCVVEDGIRMAGKEDIIAMKADVILRGGRKKDFWDIHELLEDYSIRQILLLHEERYPYIYDRDTILAALVDFSSADEEFDPICLKGKYWEIIKNDIVKEVDAVK